MTLFRIDKLSSCAQTQDLTIKLSSCAKAQDLTIKLSSCAKAQDLRPEGTPGRYRAPSPSPTAKSRPISPPRSTVPRSPPARG
ncbi:hypothetical protein KL86PLE_90561 [uncultured Pleomorphomonas sp.]|uniref:Uncharacterized protein n=1 Tax=uncultured Pleomorphomonas sp. TaxID=442121 RepID=A0A212LQ22_9HYPH|nr:hypothetical protein KL86PLE_90561 [uncultured Pleomorphomonas sp.]